MVILTITHIQRKLACCPLRRQRRNTLTKIPRVFMDFGAWFLKTNIGQHINYQRPPVFLAAFGRFLVKRNIQERKRTRLTTVKWGVFLFKRTRENHKHLCYNVCMKQNKPITILLYEDDLPKLNEIRCVNCSRMLCKINAHVKSISFGEGYDPETQRELVSGMNVVEQKCRGCDCIYKFLFQK